jgi:hypothetical protein
MPFVIRVDDAGRTSWMMPPNAHGFRALSDRANADVFATQAEAQAVVDRLFDPFGRIGVRLFVEPVD